MKSSRKFASIDELQSWLVSKDINISHWGKLPAKSLEDLWKELTQGEAFINDDPPRRIIRVVRIIIRKDGKLLIEGQQKRGNSGVRFRGYPPSEKVILGETTLNAALRCVEEEFRIDKSQVKILEQPSLFSTETRESDSFPGLYTTYEIYETKLEIDELPDHTFWTIEKSNSNPPLVEHQWIWLEEHDA